jgi:hypothetical protein
VTLPSILGTLSAKLVLGLSLALAASMTGNFLQARAAWVAHGEAKAAKKVDALATENAGLKQTAAINDALKQAATPQNAALLAELEGIAERGRAVRVVYRQAATKAPLPAVCVPGQERMDAVNLGLGPKS